MSLDSQFLKAGLFGEASLHTLETCQQIPDTEGCVVAADGLASRCRLPVPPEAPCPLWTLRRVRTPTVPFTSKELEQRAGHTGSRACRTGSRGRTRPSATPVRAGPVTSKNVLRFA